MDVLKECTGKEAMTLMLLERVNQMDAVINDLPLETRLSSKQLQAAIENIRMDIIDMHHNLGGVKVRILNMESNLNYLLAQHNSMRPPLCLKIALISWSLLALAHTAKMSAALWSFGF